MKRLGAIFLFVVMMTFAAQAIGLQHGLFRSQSTQGDPWQGTATIADEHYRITVYPDYLDVELEWVFEVGGTAPSEYADALEIVGNLNLVDKSVVVGMITWWNGDILQGKLKTNTVAREQYEEVVDRSSDAPPPPRDPVLLEWIRDDNYDISLFPVEFGKTRKVRIHYLIPAFNHNGVNKIDYPHAFTDNATVSMRKGEGVASYRIETTEWSLPYMNTAFDELKSADYSFEAYGGSQMQRISYIIPELKEPSEQSTFYIGGFSTESFSGQMAHITTMTGEEALKCTDMAEDFVILWRWNHPSVLEKYAGQIVEQSKLLQEFLDGLEAVNKRAALIIDREGGERVTFSLSSKGSAEYNRMVNYLRELAGRDVVEPPLRSTPRAEEIKFDYEKTFREFEDALTAAIALFDDGSDALQHLLILTAGPRLVYSVVADQHVVIPDGVNVTLLKSYLRTAMGAESGDEQNVVDAYWPGVDFGPFIYAQTGGLSVTARVTNGMQSDTIEVLSGTIDEQSYCPPVSVTEMHLYSSQPLVPKINWTISHNDKVVSQFTEIPKVVSLADGMQYARLIGSSVYLTPLAESMPSSMASTLGFIDEKYSLVALEEDKLPESVAASYKDEGVPLLTDAEISPAEDEVADMPVKDWLAVNEPEPMGLAYCNWYAIRGGWFLEDLVTDMVDAPAAKTNDVFGRVATPQVATLYGENPELYIDYESALAAEPVPLMPVLKNQLGVLLKDGKLVITLSGLSREQLNQLTLLVHDLCGSVVREWSAADFGAAGFVTVSGLSRGTYLLRARGAGIDIARHVVVR